MDLRASLSQFTGGGAIKNTIADQLSSITTQNASVAALGALPGLSDVSTTVAALTASVSAKWTAMLSALPIALPAMKAVHTLEKKMEMLEGGVSSSAGSASFQSYFGAVDNIKAQMATLQASVSSSITNMGTAARGVSGVAGTGPAALQSLASKIPPPKIPDPQNTANQITNPAYTSFMSANSGSLGGLMSTATAMRTNATAAQTAIEGQFAAADASYKAGFDTLKGMAFAQFCAMPQPAPVRDVINKAVHETAIPKTTDLAQVQRSGATWGASQTIATTRMSPSVASEAFEDAGSRPTVSASTYTPSASTPAQLAKIRAQIDTQTNAVQAACDAADESGRAFTAWMNSVNYAATKNNRAVNPEAYESLRAQAETQPSCIEMKSRMATYNREKDRLLHLRKVLAYMLSTGPWPGNPDGPW